jgi:hypothetical protein
VIPNPTVILGAAVISVNGISTEENVPIPDVSQGAWVISVSGIPSAEGVGSPEVVNSITPAGITSLEAFGNPSLAGGNISVSPVGIVSGEDFGETIVRNLWVLSPSGIASLESVSPGIVTLVVRNNLMTDFETDLDSVFFGNDFEFAEAVTYEDLDGVSYALKGIFDHEFQAVDVESGAEITSTQPVLWTQTSKLRKEPRTNDIVIIRGIRFKVVDNQPDGTGVSMLFLNRENML